MTNNDKSLKKCVVCGANATGFKYYSVYSCESCKSFFRRNALTKKDLKCNFGDNCTIDCVTRNFCKKCRLKKCFAVGMKKELILSKEERLLKYMRINENRRLREEENKKKLSVESIINDTNCQTEETNRCECSQIPVRDVLNEILDNNTISEEKLNEEILELKSYISNIKSIDSSVDINQNEVRFKSSVLSIVRPITDYRNNFNELESIKLTEILCALNVWKENYLLRTTNEGIEYWSASDIWSQKCQRDVANVVNLAKYLNAFKNICAEDKVTLLMYSSLEVHYLRLICDNNYDKQYCNIFTNRGNVTIIRMDLWRDEHGDIYKMFTKYLNKFSLEWDCDELTLDLLTIISLFNPNRPDIIHKDVITFHQYVYMYLLQRYLLLRYRSESESKRKFSNLINCLRLLQTILDMCAQNQFHPEPNCLKTVIREITN